MNIHEVFLTLQQQMAARLTDTRKHIQHAVAKGDVSENEWLTLLCTYLPKRYNVKKAFVLDHTGKESQQIDIVIFDRFYSPFLFEVQGQVYIPAESVYAVFEVKQDLTLADLKYAADKVASVRELTRTSAPIVDRGVTRPARIPGHIFGGILTLEGALTTGMTDFLGQSSADKIMDFGCSLGGKSFFLDAEKKVITESANENALIFFFLRLLFELQKVGTAPPMEIDKYAASIWEA